MTTSSGKRNQHTNLSKLLTACLDVAVFGSSGAHPFLHAGARDMRCAVVFGDNATGKSLFTKVMRAFIGPRQEAGAECLSVSMATRTESGIGAGLFMYLDESYNSTGVSSLHAVLGAFDNAKKRQHRVWLFFDEPDAGLSDRYAAALGSFIAREINNLPIHILGVTIVTHSRPLLRHLVAGLNGEPHAVAMGLDRTLADFIDPENPVNAAPASTKELLALADESYALRTRLFDIMNGHSASPRASQGARKPSAGTPRVSRNDRARTKKPVGT